MAAISEAPFDTPNLPVIFEPPVEPGFTPTLMLPGWRAAHVGFSHDGFLLDGLDVWSLPWREQLGSAVMLAHPAHPQQQHQFTIYTVEDGKRATRFAADELSNGVWGFYRWIVPADAPEGLSADGSLQFAHSLGDAVGHRHDNNRPVVTIRDVVTGGILFDGTAWESSRVVPQDDGSLLLALEHGNRQSIFRIAPPARSFRNLASPNPDRPLAELGAAAAVEHAESTDESSSYVGRRIAPDGSILVELQAVEWSNTHWVYSPRVTEIATGLVLLDLWGTDWDAVVGFPRNGVIELGFRRYHVGGGLEAEIALDGRRFTIREPSGTVSEGPLVEMPTALETVSRRVAAELPPRIPSLPPTTRRSWGVALLILAGAVLALAGAAFLAYRSTPQPVQKLDQIPPMPPDLTPR